MAAAIIRDTSAQLDTPRDFSTARPGDGRGFDLVVSAIRPEPAKRRRRRVS
jgi:hypothetical protein